MKQTAIVLSVIALLFSAPVFADDDEGCRGNCRGGDTNVDVNNRNYNSAYSSSYSHSYSSQGQYQDQRQGQIGINKAVGSGNTTDVTFEQSYRESAQSATSPGGVVGKCLAAFGVGVQSRGFGLSFGANRQVKRCQDRELAAMLWEMGERSAAKAIMARELDEWSARKTREDGITAAHEADNGLEAK